MAKIYPSGLDTGEVKGLTERARHCCRWIEKWCIVDGAYMRLAPYQVKFIKHFMAGDIGGPRIITRGVISTARKSGKSSLCSAILLYGTTAKGCPQASDFYTIAAGSKDQAFVLFDYWRAMIEANPKLLARYDLSPMGRKATNKVNRNRIEALGTSPRSAQGRNVAGFCADEVAQSKDGGALINAMEMASPKISTGLGWGLLCSTYSPMAGNVLQDKIAMVKLGHKQGLLKEWYVQVHSAANLGNDVDIFSDDALIEANPGLSVYPGQQPLIEYQVLDQARMEARLDATARANFKTYRLNISTATNMTGLIDLNKWKALGLTREESREMMERIKGTPIRGAVDLSSSLDLTSVAIVSEETGFCTTMSWLPEGRVEMATQTDRNPYAEWADEGWLRLCKGKTIDYRDIALYIKELFADYQVQAFRFDPWKWDAIKPVLRHAEVGLDPDDPVFVPCRQGEVTYTALISNFELVTESGWLKHDSSPVLAQAVVGAGVTEKPHAANGARSIVKQTRNQRIDPIVSLLMALGPAPDKKKEKPTSMDISAFYEGWD